MQIKEPKFKRGDKVIDEYGNIYIVLEISSYSFIHNDYWYGVENDIEKRVMLESKLELYQEPPKTVWELKTGDKCFFITSAGNISDWYWDEQPAKIGNCFLTKEEAEYELERRKIEAEMLRLGGRRVFKKGENNYYIVCDFDSHYDIWISNKSDGFARMMIYFDSDKECGNAIETIGEYRIKRYIFGVDS